MIEIGKIIIFLSVTILIFYMIRLFFFNLRKSHYKTHAFFVLIIGIGLLGFATFFDMIFYLIKNQYIYIAIKILFTLGGTVYILGVILWSNYTEKIIESLEERAQTDPLTGILNRHGLEQIYNRIEKKDKSFYIIVCDLDGTKMINDSKGHLFGDKYITSTTKVIRSVIGTRGHIARTGGDEFVILLEYIAFHELEKIIFKTKQKVCQILPEHKIGISMGHSIFPNDGITFEELMRVADNRMYDDKRSKKKSDALII